MGSQRVRHDWATNRHTHEDRGYVSLVLLIAAFWLFSLLFPKKPGFESRVIRLYHPFFVVVLTHWLWVIPVHFLRTLAPDSPSLSLSSVQFSSVTQSCPTLCGPMNRSMPGLPVHHQLPGFTQTHVHWVSDAIQPSHPLSSPSPPAPNPSQHQSLFQWVNSSHEVAKVLEFQL